jgi:homoserine O-acetyltransferase
MYNQTAIDNHKNAISYQRYQGKKLADRFNAYSYWFLSKSMDSHNVGRERISIVAALQNIRAKTLVIAIESDELFPVQEQEFLAQNIPAASLSIITSSYGHDGFLLEYKAINQIVSNFLGNSAICKHPTNHQAE